MGFEKEYYTKVPPKHFANKVFIKMSPQRILEWCGTTHNHKYYENIFEPELIESSK